MCSPWSFSCLDCRFPKHPWNNPGMHFCGICTEWLKCRQYHPKWKNKTAWVLDLQAGTSAVNDSLESWSKNSLLGVFRVELLGRGSTLEPWHSREGALAPPASLWGALNEFPDWGGWEAQASLAFVFWGIHVPAVTSLHHCSRVRLVLKENSTQEEWKCLGLEMSFVKLK